MADDEERVELAGLARSRPVARTPVRAAHPTILGPAPAALACPYLHVDDAGAGCLAMRPAVRLSDRQVDLLCAVAVHVSCPRYVRADGARPVRSTALPGAISPAELEAMAGRAEPKPGVRPVDMNAPSARVASTIDAAETEAAVEVAEAADAVEIAPAGRMAGGAAAVGPGLVPATLGLVDTDMSMGPTSSVDAAGGLAAAASADVAGTDLGPAPGSSRPPIPASEQAAGAQSPEARRARGRRSARPAPMDIRVRPATIAASAILVGAIVLVFVLLTIRGGLALPAPSASPTGQALASPTASSVATAGPSARPSATPSLSPSLVPSSTAAPSPSLPSTTPGPFPPDRLALLTACSQGPDCWQYRIKSGDSLRNIAKFFGVTYPALLAANPQIANPSIIHPGELIFIPVPGS